MNNSSASAAVLVPIILCDGPYILLTRRTTSLKHHAGQICFPGGKIESGEGPEEALRRELNEELGIDADIGAGVARIRHNYRNGGAVDLQFFTVRNYRGELDNRIFQQMLWSSFAALPQYDFLAADLGLIRDLADGRLTMPQTTS